VLSPLRTAEVFATLPSTASPRYFHRPRIREALARNICVILGNDDLRIRLARSANDFIKQFTWERSANLMEGFLFRAVQPKPLGQLSNSSIEAIPRMSMRPRMEVW